MSVLLDTQALVVLLDDLRRLPEAAQEELQRPEPALVSAASVWEVAIKSASGKLDAPDDLPDVLAAHPAFDLIPISPTVAWATRELPLIHRDPFDRLIIAQARASGLPVITGDPVFARYGVGVIW